MSHGIDKKTYVEADRQTTKSLTFDLLDSLYKKVDCQIDNCNDRFRLLEDKKKKDTIISSLSGFLIGIVAMAAYYVRIFISSKH